MDCGTLTTHGTRCPTCDRINHQAAYGGMWRKVSKAQRARAPYCQCPGCTLHQGFCGTESDLTTDHVVPHAHGGTANDGVRTLCRSCNAAIRDRV